MGKVHGGNRVGVCNGEAVMQSGCSLIRHRPAAAEGEASGDPVAGAVSRQRRAAGGAGGLRL